MSRGRLGAHLPANNSGSAFSEYRGDRDAPRPTGKQGSAVVSALTVSLPQTYQRCSPHFTYNHQLVPRRVLTKPSEGVDNQGYDNSNSDLVVCVNDVFVSTTGARYVVKDLLGQGTFGQVFRCVEAEGGGGQVAVKVIKNQPAYYHQARVEVGVLQYLNTRADPADKHHIVRMKDFFLFRNHLCLAFELLNLNLYELIRHNKFRGLSLPLVRVFTTQILDALMVLRDSRIVHCDLKPENVLLKTIETGEVKVIDFGSACFDNRTVYSYIQSRFYRSPEVVVGYPYTMAIDMWSLGCMAAELYLGLPLFPGACEHDLLCRMLTMLGPLPDRLLMHGKNVHKFFKLGQEEVVADPATGEPVVRRRYAVRSREEYEAATGQPAPTGKNYFQHTSLADIVGAYPLRGSLSNEQAARERALREAFVDFLLGVLDLDPASRWTPRQAMQHPFVTGEAFTGPFQPPSDPSSTPTSKQGALWGDASPSPTPVGTPVSIPNSRHARAGQAAAAAGVAASPWMGAVPAPGSSAAAAAALMATSPQVHAQAHAAAMAAVQAQMSLRQQQQQAAALGGAGGMGLQNGYYPSAAVAEYSAAHSLQAIIPTLAAAAVAAGYGGPSLGGTPMAHSLAAPLMSPPSRSFGPHPRFGDFNAAAMLGGHSMLDSMGSAGALGSGLHTPSRSGNLAFSPMQLGSFTPSSVTTYQAALAAAHAAMAHQQQQGQQHHRVAVATAAQQSPVYAFQQQQGQGQHAVELAQQQAPPWQLPSASTAAAAAAAEEQRQPPPQQLLARQAQQAQAQALQRMQGVQQPGGDASRATSRWVSMEGSLEGTPPRLGADGLSAAAAADESGPNPGDWDPLWSDDLLEDDGSQQGGRSPAAALRGQAGSARHTAQQQQQQPRQGENGSALMPPPPYGGAWSRGPGAGPQQAQQQQQQQQQQGPEGAGPSLADAELPGSYSLPLPTTLLLGLQGGQQGLSLHQAAAQAQQQQQQGQQRQEYAPQHTRMQSVGADLPLPSSALLGNPERQPGMGARRDGSAAGQAPGPPPQLASQQGAAAPAGEGPSRLAALLLAAAHQQEQQQQQQPLRSTQAASASGAAAAGGSGSSLGQTYMPGQQQGSPTAGTAPRAASGRRSYEAAPASSSFEFHHRGPPQPLQLPQQAHVANGTAGAVQLSEALSPFLLQQAQQYPQQQQQLPRQQGMHALPAAVAAAGYEGPLLGTQLPGWQGVGMAGGGAGTGLEAAAAALQQALSTQLSARLTQELALSGLSSEDLGAAAAALPLLQQQHLGQQQQQQQLQGVVGLQPPWPYAAAAAADDPQQHPAQQASRHNQPMQRMQGFDIMR